MAQRKSTSATGAAKPPVSEAIPAPLPAAAADEIMTLIVAVHGIGDQKRFATIQSVAHRLGRYLDEPGMVSLGQFHSPRTEGEQEVKVAAYSFPHYPEIGLAEIFWADIPREAQQKEDTLEETKAWALTIVERLRKRDRETAGRRPKTAPDGESVNYEKTEAVVTEMIETIETLENLMKIGEKAGLVKFELGNLLDDYIGDVQIVSEFPDYGGRIFEQVGKVMKGLMGQHKKVKRIYLVAHSEGTVVSFRALLQALSHPEKPGEDWVDKVRGYMTIGSPIDKHIVMWPRLWSDFAKPDLVPKHRTEPIVWWNYYDFGDPVGFKLDTARLWLMDNGWVQPDPEKVTDDKPPMPLPAPGQTIFDFPPTQDIGFTRYPLPGKAHNDYWEDAAVFDHFFKNVLGLKRKKKGVEITEKVPEPGLVWWCWPVSWCLPYVLCFVLLLAATYVLYKGLAPFVGELEDPQSLAKSVAGIACLLGGITVMSRIPRLMKVGRWYLVSIAVFLIGAFAYSHWVDPSIQRNVGLGFTGWLGEDPAWAVIVVGAIIAAVSAWLSKKFPKWGMRPLMGLAGLATLISVLGMLHSPDLPLAAKDAPLWPLVLAGLGFLYLWWLTALIFDLVFVWHRYIRGNEAVNFLKEIRA